MKLKVLKLSKKFFLLSSFICSFSALVASSFHEYIAKGEEFYNSKNYKQALIQYKSALEINPNSSKANLGYANASLALGYLGDAKTSFEKVLQLTPKNKQAIVGLAEVLSLEGKHKAGLELIEKALEEEPYNPFLLLEVPKIYLRVGNKELALKKLEDAEKKIEPNVTYKVLLIQAYIANQKFESALKIVNELITKNPENPESFYVKAKLNHALAHNETNLEKVALYMEEAKENLLTSIRLNQNYEEGKRLLVYNYIWLKKYEEALNTCNEILESDPLDSEIIYLRNYLSLQLGNIQNAAKDLSLLLKLNETDVLVRGAAEDFAIENLNEKHLLRTNLGKYQLEEYYKFKEDYNFKNAEFHLERAHKLIPENFKLRKELMNFYYSRGNRQKLMQLLLRLREDDPDNIKINNRIENVLKTLRDSLAYKEGFLDKEANLDESIRTTPEIFIFDLKPTEFFPKQPNISQILTNTIKFALSLHSKVKLIPAEEEKKIRIELGKSSSLANYTNGLYYSSENLARLSEFRKRHNPIRYVGYGEILESEENLSVLFQIYDRLTGKQIKQFRVSSFGKNRISDLGIRVANEITNSIPYEGKVIKVKADTILINFGFRDGLKKGDEVSIFSQNKKFVGTVLETDEYISEVKIEEKNWKPFIGTEYRVFKQEKKK